MFSLRSARSVNTAPVVALGLLGGYLTARETGIRPLGGVLLGACGLWAGRSWVAKTDPLTTVALTGIYLGGFGLSHPLAKKVGTWPAVLGVTAVSALASYALADRRV